MTNIDGITPRTPHNPEKPVKVDKEDTNMSISHLLLKGFVESVIKDEPFEVKFKSLTTEEQHASDVIVTRNYGAQ